MLLGDRRAQSSADFLDETGHRVFRRYDIAWATEMGTRVVVHYIEEWNTEEDLKRQLLSDRFAVLAELMEHASEQPTIEFALRGATRGLEYTEKVRKSGER